MSDDFEAESRQPPQIGKLGMYNASRQPFPGKSWNFHPFYSIKKFATPPPSPQPLRFPPAGILLANRDQETLHELPYLAVTQTRISQMVYMEKKSVICHVRNSFTPCRPLSVLQSTKGEFLIDLSRSDGEKSGKFCCLKKWCRRWERIQTLALVDSDWIIKRPRRLKWRKFIYVKRCDDDKATLSQTSTLLLLSFPALPQITTCIVLTSLSIWSLESLQSFHAEV